ncbi:phosphoribosylaminoimidazole-succinocarboxamide synthase [Punctularia strigosozonata HHB-11173 SS5]|uniref:Phosphoribosylaminoimidazole-succinocarboxamide synthase n=1 Tax=Punctularia strigosozonata (strain HHB-11173) TaxID=741275 RepID=R7S3U2_PUNST|nr:phosphoribosylaminoimidazole-succinocarboxamide synthase [Punctularia strigosozonata HHB-11173 SS5]EIN03901.1 phosphoribosylaminoimidazole-succinocarboxamide synthase [Punctularia strigosozonata HHB-11173 SS5]
MSALLNSDLPELKLLSKGKVRDIYATSSPDHLLFVASDRISAYDVILRNGIPDKGKILTKISHFWFEKLKDIVPNHVVTVNVDEMPEEVRKYKDQLEGRTMLVKKAKVIPLEAIVRGYLTDRSSSLWPNQLQGSAWSEYKKSGTVHGIPLPSGLVESQKLPEPLFTPSTKAEQGQHDENISPEQASKLIGEKLYLNISLAAVELYNAAAEYALSRGLILADTKFEFGLVPSAAGDSEDIILIDEALTPDSSRYWPAASYEAGKPQPSFDKQYLRDWLVAAGFRKGLENGPEGKEGQGWTIDEEVVEGTRKRYAEALEMLTA